MNLHNKQAETDVAGVTRREIIMIHSVCHEGGNTANGRHTVYQSLRDIDVTQTVFSQKTGKTL